MRRLRRFSIALSVVVVPLLCAEPLALSGIRFYQRAIGPLAARAGMTCRFVPSCSHYALTVIERDGLLGGGWRALGRIARCHPGTPMGTQDEP